MKLSQAGRGWSRVVLWNGLFAMGALAHADTPAPNRIYDANCALCHQKAGIGMKGQFPRLAGRAGEFAATPAGRRYLIEVALFGMAGAMDVDGVSVVGVMPPFAMLSDADLASALSYIVSLEAPAQNPGASRDKRKPPPIEAAEIKAVRDGQPLSPSQVRANRDALPAAKKGG